MDIEKRPPSIEGKLKKEFLRYDNEKKQRTLKDTLKVGCLLVKMGFDKMI